MGPNGAANGPSPSFVNRQTCISRRKLRAASRASANEKIGIATAII